MKQSITIKYNCLDNISRNKIRFAIACFPTTFGMRAFPNKICRLSEHYSRIINNEVILYIEALEDGWWRIYSYGTESELRTLILPFKKEN